MAEGMHIYIPNTNYNLFENHQQLRAGYIQQRKAKHTKKINLNPSFQTTEFHFFSLSKIKVKKSLQQNISCVRPITKQKTR